MKDKILSIRLPIQKGLLHILIDKLDERYQTRSQPFLCLLYKAILATGYYGLFRIGELTTGDHLIQLNDVFAADNRDKVLIVLRTSKTHSLADTPQKIKIDSKDANLTTRQAQYCPVILLSDYIDARLEICQTGPLFTFSDGSPVKPEHFRAVLKNAIKKCGLDPNLYDMHSMRSGRSCDMFKEGYEVQTIKKRGHWRSNAVYDYLRDC